MEGTRVLLKESLSHKDYAEIKELEQICLQKDSGIYLKLELDFKIRMAELQNKAAALPSRETNEFFCYYNDQLIGYLGLFNLGGRTAEMTGMVHPKHRRRGVFTKLYQLALNECRKRSLSEVWLVCDSRSASGRAFLRHIQTKPSFSEFLMVHALTESGKPGMNRTAGQETEKGKLRLRKAAESDVLAIMDMNWKCFDVTGFIGMMPEEEEKINRITYLIEMEQQDLCNAPGFQESQDSRNSQLIGKIRVEQYDDSCTLGGFCILPLYRGRGYGSRALMAVIRNLTQQGIRHIQLYVDTGNQSAIRTYQKCGFTQQTTLEYYRVN